MTHKVFDLTDGTGDSIRLDFIESPEYADHPVIRIRKVASGGRVRQGPDIPIQDLWRFTASLFTLVSENNSDHEDIS